jgi:hypothetical protein
VSSDKSSYEKIINNIVLKINEFLSIIAYGLSGIILMIIGFSKAYFNYMEQYDQTGSIYLNAVQTGGIVLLLIGFGILYNATVKQSILMQQNLINEKNQGSNSSSKIETAISALILDYVKERELSRIQTNPTIQSHETELLDNISLQ